MKKGGSLNGVGGWLLFFIITLVFITPIINLSTIFSNSDSYLIFGSLAIISLFILAGIFLWTRKPYAVKFAKIVLIVNGISLILNSFLFSDYSLLRGIPYCIIWVLYLYNSKRVRQTYGKLKETTTGYQIWPKVAIIFAVLESGYGFIFSIVSLISISKNRRLKGIALSVIALIISLVVFAALSFYGAAEGGYAPESIKTECSNFCYDVAGADYYLVEYIYSDSNYNCNCIDADSKIISKKSFSDPSSTSGLTGGVIGTSNKVLMRYNVFPVPSIFNTRKYAPVEIP